MSVIAFFVIAFGTVAAWLMLLGSLLGLFILLTFLLQHGPDQPSRWTRASK